MSRQRRADLSLLLVAAVWGATFVMVSRAVGLVGPLTFLALRFGLAALVLAPFALGAARRAGRPGLRAGVLVGGLLAAGYALQTAGLRYTSATRAGFLTGLAVVLVPFFAWLLLGHPPGLGPFLGVLLAAAGLALMAWTPGEPPALNRGDWLVLGCALAFALQLVAVAAWAPTLDPRALALVQIATAALLALGAAALRETTSGPLPPAVWGAALFTGIFATALAFLAQASAQAHTSPTHVAVIFATEPVFAGLAGVLLAGERLTRSAWLGCGLILAGMLVAELWPAGREPKGRGS
jgi:drug/metabolite transporter (DMT)-like permease